MFMTARPGVHRRLIAALAAATVACGSDSSTDPVDATLPAHIAIVPVASTKIFIGLTLQLEAVVTDGNGDTLSTAPVTWSSSRLDDAPVSSKGLVLGVNHANAMITASSGDLKATLPIQVIRLATYSYSPSDTTLDPNQVIQYVITGRDVAGVQHTNLPLVWFSSDPALATVSPTGQVTALESDGGSLNVIFDLGDLFGQLTLVVAPAPVATITVSSATLLVGASSLITRQLKSLNGTVLDRPVVWSSSDPLTASVTQAGLVAGLKSGTVTITATADGVSGSGSVVVNALPAFSALAEGSARCGLTAGSELFCWPRLDSAPAQVAIGFQFTSVSADSHTCGLTAGGTAYCWGFNNFGQLGDGTQTERIQPTPVLGGLTFSSIATGGEYTCGIATGGAAYCWGVNFGGQLGDGTYEYRTTPVPVSGGHQFIQLSASRVQSRVTCGVTTGNQAYCWGDNNDGQLGTGDSVASTTPRLVTGGLSFQSISVNDFHACAVTTAQAAFCWGPNVYGELGDGSLVSAASPQPVGGGDTYNSVSAGYLFTCGLTGGNVLQCWGWNESYQLGDGTLTQRELPVSVGNGYTGLNTNSNGGCGLASGRIYCWGLTQHVPTLLPGQQ